MIPLSSPNITQKEIDYVNEVLKSRHLALGPYLEKFENSFKKLIDAKFAIGVNSGTSALHLLLKSSGFKSGDDLITSSFTFISSSNIAAFEDGRPLFIDINPKDYNLDVEKLEYFLKNNKTDKIKAFVGVDIFGQPLNWDKIDDILKGSDIKIIEDSCEALGAEYKNHKIGKKGIGGTFAFYPNKQITTGEGGIIVTDNPDVYELSKSMSNQGRNLNSQWLEHQRLGYNYRLDEMSAALGLAQMERLEWILEQRDKKAKYYNNLFQNENRIVLPKINEYTTKMSWFVYVIRLDLKWIDKIINIPSWIRDMELPLKIKSDRYDEWGKNITKIKKVLNIFIDKLNKKGIQSKNYFTPVHLQPFYRKNWGYKLGDLPYTELISSLTIALPFFTGIKEIQQNTVYEKILDTLEEIEYESKK